MLVSTEITREFPSGPSVKYSSRSSRWMLRFSLCLLAISCCRERRERWGMNEWFGRERGGESLWRFEMPEDCVIHA